MFSLNYTKSDWSRSVQRACDVTGLALRVGDGMGRTVHLWPIGTRRAVKERWPQGMVWGQGQGWASPVVLLQPPLFYSPAQEDHSWCPLHSIQLGLHHLSLMPSPPLMRLEVFAQKGKQVLFQGVCHCMSVQNLEAARSLIPGGCLEQPDLFRISPKLKPN